MLFRSTGRNLNASTKLFRQWNTRWTCSVTNSCGSYRSRWWVWARTSSRTCQRVFLVLPSLFLLVVRINSRTLMTLLRALVLIGAGGKTLFILIDAGGKTLFVLIDAGGKTLFVLIGAWGKTLFILIGAWGKALFVLIGAGGNHKLSLYIGRCWRNSALSAVWCSVIFQLQKAATKNLIALKSLSENNEVFFCYTKLNYSRNSYQMGS